jgi:hypothetical protein
MRRILRFTSLIATTSLIAVVLYASPAAALSVDRAELRSNELRIEGGDAASNADIVVDGIVVGSADGGGAYNIRFSPFTSPTCVAEVSDGVETHSVQLDRCTPSGPTPNQGPSAAAGANQTVVDADGSGAEVVALNGSGSSDPDGSIASYAWSNGPTTLGTTVSISPSLNVGTHTVILEVTDNEGATAQDQVVVIVDPQPAANQPPTADAGPDIERTDDDGNGTETVVLESFGSVDPDGTIVSYEWSKDGVVIASANGVAIGQPVGVNTITLTVTDDQGATATDELIVTINPMPVAGNNPPIANAGPDQTVLDADNSGTQTVTLDGSVSTDADGVIVSYAWTEGGAPLTAGAGQENPPITNAVVGGTFDHLFESNQPDPDGFIPAAFGQSATAAGDVNGDGFGDIIIGAETWWDQTQVGNERQEGAALVFLGSAAGPVGNNPSNANAVIEMNEATATVSDVASAGDVNGDGFGDIIVGSQFYPSILPGTQLAVDGAAFVFHGGPNGITATGAEQANATILATQLGSAMGNWVDGAGDVNGDGFADVLVSVPRRGTLFPAEIPINDRSGNYGMILVFHGGPNGITGTGISDADAVILPYEDTGQPLPPVDAQVQQAVGAGDINNDGFDDVVVGGTSITVYFGGPSGITAQDVFDANNRVFADPPLGVSQSIAGASPGFLVSGAGDINNDGFADVVASLPGKQLVPGAVETQQGAVYVMLGGPTGLNITSTSQAHTTITGEFSVETVGFSIDGPGDIDADGFDDLVIGAISYAGSLDSEGVAYIFRGTAQGIIATTIPEADSRLEARQSQAARFTNRIRFDAKGAGDVNGDGFIDVIVGKGYYDNGELNEGAAFLYNGQAYPANPNQPPVPVAGADQDVFDEDADGTITVSVDGTASFDLDGSIVSYEWYQATVNGGTGEVLKATGVTATFELPFLSPIPANGHKVTLVVTDDQGIRRGDVMTIFPKLAPTTLEINEDFATLNNWTTIGNVTLGDEGTAFPAAPHARLQGTASMARTFSPVANTTGLDLTFWAKGTQFGTNDRIAVQASFNGGPFVDYFTLTSADVTGGFVFYGGSTFPISMSWWPSTASSVTLRYESTLSAGADFWFGSTAVRSIQAPTGGATNVLPIANAGLDITAVDNDGSGDEVVNLDGSASDDLDGSISSYEWRDGLSVIGTTAGISTTLPVGTHALLLAVTDNDGATDFDQVTVTVLPQPGGPTLDVDLAVGTHTITLTVTDDDGAFTTDNVVVVVEAPAVDQPPVANAGPDQTVVDTDGNTLEVVTFDGTASSDPDGTIVAYTWSENGSQIAAGVAPQVPLAVGAHTLTLTVTDSAGATATDTVVITVNPFDPATNMSPIANAGPDQTVIDTDGDTLEVVTFDGTASSDPDGTIVSYIWTLNGNPLGNTATFSVTRPLGTFVVTLTVTDNVGATASDTVTVVVQAPSDPVLTSLTIEPGSLVGGANAVGHLILSSVAPTGGTVVTLTSLHAAVTVPATVTIPQGATTASFAVTSSSVVSETTATITATLGSSTTSTTVTLSPVSPPPPPATEFETVSFSGRINRNSTLTLTIPVGAAGDLQFDLQWDDDRVEVDVTLLDPSGAVVFSDTSPAFPKSAVVPVSSIGDHQLQLRNTIDRDADYTLIVTYPVAGTTTPPL